MCQTGAGSPRLEAESAVDRRVDASTKEHLVSIRGWRGFNNPWMLEDEGDVEYSYINLLMNPERYTGYKVVFLPFLALALSCIMHLLLVQGYKVHVSRTLTLALS